MSTTQQIQKDYNKITDFSNGALYKLAEKHGISLDKLMEIIEF